MTLCVLKFAAFVAGHMPVAVLAFLGRFFGSLAYKLDKKHRGIALSNIKRAYGPSLSDKEAERTARKVFENLGMTAFEFMRLPWLKRKDLDGYVEWDGRENLDKALEKGRGAMLITAHFGNWELMAASYALCGYPIDVVVRPIDNPVLEQFVKWARSQSGNTMVAKNRSMRRLLTTLKTNGIAGILVDQNVALVEGVFVDFFGTLACTNRGPAILALASGAAVLPTFIVREGARHRIIVGKEVQLSVTGDKERDAFENTARMTKTAEDMIRKYPDQWFWVHRRWKTRPPEEAKKTA